MTAKQGRFATTRWSLDLAPVARKKLELVRGLTLRMEETKDAYSRHVEMLKTPALHLSSLRARLADAPAVAERR